MVTILIILCFIFIYVQYKFNQYDYWLSTIIKDLDFLKYDCDARYFDFLNYLYKNYHVQEDVNGNPVISRVNWSEQDEIKLIKFKYQLDKDAKRLGLPIINTYLPDSIDN